MAARTTPPRRIRARLQLGAASLVAGLAGGVLAVLPAQEAGAATFTVTNCNGSGPGSLPDAVAAASSGDTINFASNLSCPPSSPINLTSTLGIAENLTISGPGATTMAVSGANGVGVIGIGSGVVDISALTIEDGFSSIAGGGIYNNGGTVNVTDSTVSGNFATDGGGIYNYGGTVNLTDSTVSGNGAASGGGIYNYGGTVNLTDSTVAGNEATTGFGGGGLYNDNGGAVTITDSTLSGNSASLDGGGIFNNIFCTVTITDSTLSGNSALDGGGIYNDKHGAVTFIDSTVSGNAGGGISGGVASVTNAGATIVAGNSGFNCDSPVTSLGYNLTDDTDGTACNFTQPTDVVNANPLLGALGDNGGPTQTMLPASGSPAIAAIPPGTTLNSTSVCPRTDQRGVSSTFGQNCTIGAVEVAPIATTTSIISENPPAASPAIPVAFTALVTPASAGPPLTGNVTFSFVCAGSNCSSSSGTLGSAPIDPTSDQAIFTTTGGQLPVGALYITATYSGDSNYLGSNGSVVYTVDASCNTNPWPSSTSGYPQVEDGGPTGFYIGQSNGWWTLYTSQDTTNRAKGTVFSGTITTMSARFLDVTALKNERGDVAKLNGNNKISFKFFTHRSLDSVTFFVGCGNDVKFTLMVDGIKAPLSEIFIGNPTTNPLSNPVTYNR